MRSHRRRVPLEHALIAGSDEDLRGIQLVLSLLPPDAYGQVIIESDSPLPALTTPARISVFRVSRSSDDADTPLMVAINCWLAEWMPHDKACDGERNVSVWIGTHSSGRLNDQCRALGDLVDRI